MEKGEILKTEVWMEQRSLKKNCAERKILHSCA
jgi:hypothetical protein